MGVPIFKFIPYGSDIIAQIKLPDGTSVNSKPVPTKQEVRQMCFGLEQQKAFLQKCLS